MWRIPWLWQYLPWIWYQQNLIFWNSHSVNRDQTKCQINLICLYNKYNSITHDKSLIVTVYLELCDFMDVFNFNINLLSFISYYKIAIYDRSQNRSLTHNFLINL